MGKWVSAFFYVLAYWLAIGAEFIKLDLIFLERVAAELAERQPPESRPHRKISFEAGESYSMTAISRVAPADRDRIDVQHRGGDVEAGPRHRQQPQHRLLSPES